MEFASQPSVIDLEEEGRVIELDGANGKPWMDGDKPVTARIRGMYSKTYKAAKTRLLDRALKRGGKTDADEVEAAQLKVDATLVIAWDITIGGKPARPEVVFLQAPYLRTQITDEAADHAAFLPVASVG